MGCVGAGLDPKIPSILTCGCNNKVYLIFKKSLIFMGLVCAD
jgi:hypothetical protein